jgi:hypothetical protein
VLLNTYYHWTSDQRHSRSFGPGDTFLPMKTRLGGVLG